MNFWNTLYFGNPLKDWLIALGIIVITFSVIRLFKGLLIKKLKLWAARTSNSIDNFIVLAIEKSLVPFLYFAAIFFAFQYLTFNEHINQVFLLFLKERRIVK